MANLLNIDEKINFLKYSSKCNRQASEYTHPLYRYPASMSPYIARTAIVSFTQPGDIVLDPFSGGGTTAIEALIHGRYSVCSDINSLACFITRAKAYPLQLRSIKVFENWILKIIKKIQKTSVPPKPYHEKTNVNGIATQSAALLWKLSKSARRIKDRFARRSALLLVLRVGQLCFDGRRKYVRPIILKRLFEKNAPIFVERLKEYNRVVEMQFHRKPYDRLLHVINCQSNYLKHYFKPLKKKKISLILTSPPYPGVHILYHRWQIHGKIETPLPFNLINRNDGHNASYYTMGSRHEISNNFYFRQIQNVFQNLHEIISPNATIIQILSFPNPEIQFPRYLEIMKLAGYNEITSSNENNLIRDIPNRRWYTSLSQNNFKAQEYLIIHQPK